MIYFLALLAATALTIGGYVVLVLSTRSEGALRTFGKYLGFWAFTLAGLVILGAIFAAAHARHHCPFPAVHGWHERMYCPGSRTEEPREIAPAPGPRTSPAPGGTPNATAPPPPPPPESR